VFGAAYALWLCNRILFGPLITVKPGNIAVFKDMTRGELIIMAPLVFLVLVMGIYPELFLDPMHASVGALIEHMQSF